MIDSVPLLIHRGNKALRYWVQRDLFDRHDDEHWQALALMPERTGLVRKQRRDGSWLEVDKEAPETKVRIRRLMDTVRTLSLLVDLGATRNEASMQLAAQFLARAQTDEGDFRAPNVHHPNPSLTGLVLEALCRLGFDDREWVQRGFDWLERNRQRDGGWVLPLRTTDKTKPHSHLVTGMVLRALAASPTRRTSETAGQAADLLAARLFKADYYSDRGEPEYWTRLAYPFLHTDIVSVLDSLSLVGFPRQDPMVSRALLWLETTQGRDGLWQPGYGQSGPDAALWLTLAILRIFKRFQDGSAAM